MVTITKQGFRRQGKAMDDAVHVEQSSSDTAIDNGIRTDSASEPETSTVDVGQSQRVHRFIVDGIVFNSRQAANRYMNK